MTNLTFLRKIGKDWVEELCFEVFPGADETSSLIVIDGDDGEDEGDVINKDQVTKVSDTHYIVKYPHYGEYHFKLENKLN